MEGSRKWNKVGAAREEETAGFGIPKNPNPWLGQNPEAEAKQERKEDFTPILWDIPSPSQSGSGTSSPSSILIPNPIPESKPPCRHQDPLFGIHHPTGTSLDVPEGSPQALRVALGVPK